LVISRHGQVDARPHAMPPPAANRVRAVAAGRWARSACTKPRGITDEHLIEGARNISAPESVAELVSGAPLYTC
jgi:hypothetical protein